MRKFTALLTIGLIGLGALSANADGIAPVPSAIALCSGGFDQEGCLRDKAIAAMDRYEKSGYGGLLRYVPEEKRILAGIGLAGSMDGLRYGRRNRSCEAFLADSRALGEIWEDLGKPYVDAPAQVHENYEVLSRFIDAVMTQEIRESECR